MAKWDFELRIWFYNITLHIGRILFVVFILQENNIDSEVPFEK